MKKPVLSARQHELLQAIVEGRSTQEAADHLGIAEKTARNHLRVAYRTLGARDLTEAVVRALRWRLITLPKGRP